jgi:hypothetical protein
MHDKIFPTKLYYGNTYRRQFVVSDSRSRGRIVLG